MKVSMLLLAAGRGTRFGGDRPKAYVRLGGRTILQRSLEQLATLEADAEIVLAAHPDDRRRYLEDLLPALERAGLTRVVDGGATRQDSMRNALAATDPRAELVLIHDAARPFFPPAAAQEALRCAARVGAACLAVPAPDTLKRVSPDDVIEATLDRQGIWLAQTPQVARRSLLEAALEAAARDGFDGTDDVSLLERGGHTVVVVRSSPTNLKITTRDDLELARLLAAREDAP